MTLNTPHTAEFQRAYSHYDQSAHQISSFIRFKDMTGARKFRSGSRDTDHAHLGGQLVISRLSHEKLVHKI